MMIASPSENKTSKVYMRLEVRGFDGNLRQYKPPLSTTDVQNLTKRGLKHGTSVAQETCARILVIQCHRCYYVLNWSHSRLIEWLNEQEQIPLVKVHAGGSS
jgi:hypothetical protein